MGTVSFNMSPVNGIPDFSSWESHLAVNLNELSFNLDGGNKSHTNSHCFLGGWASMIGNEYITIYNIY